jgi:alkanesulfonate monooxygenase SsuD/methylene tetrahydromethanopterin reductase-like flavin-dependent oxidoreductase (luciferase family)
MHIGLAGWQGDATGGDHRAFLALFEQADRLGFDSVWFNEFHFRRQDLPYPSPLLLAAAVFARTERLRVGLSVVLLPLHHPLLLAERLAQLDFQSAGRLDVGLGRGTANPEVQRALGIDPESTRERFAAAYDLLLRAWTDETVSADGPFWSFDRVPVGPPPVQRPHPPIYIAGYTRDSIAFAAARDLPLLLSLEPPEERQLALYREVVAELDVPYDVSRFSATRHVCVAPTAAAAGELLDTLLPRLHQRRLRFAAQRGQPLDEIESRSRDVVLREQAIVGTPADCVAQIERLARVHGYGHLRCVFNGNGTLDDATTLAGMTLFAREVLPSCRGLVPRPLALKAIRAAPQAPQAP